MKKVLFVCLGNICRSPLAEALFEKHIKSNNLNNEVSCDSCGTSAYHIGSPPDERSVENARKNGLEYTNCGRQLSQQDFVDFDYIIAMDNSNLEEILEVNPNEHPHIYKLRDFDKIDKGANVPDPYFGGTQGFQAVHDIIDGATLNLLKDLSKS